MSESDSPINETSSQLQSFVKDIDRNLQTIESAAFSDKAFTRLKEKIEEYAVQLTTESIKVSKRCQADTVSISDVEHAGQYLITNLRGKIFKHLGTIGGLLLGAGLSNVLAMITTGQFNAIGVVLSFILTVVGSSMVAAHIAKE